MNGLYIREKNIKELIELCRPYLAKYEEKLSGDYLEKIVSVERERMKKLSDIAENTEFYFDAPEIDAKILKWKEMSDDDLQKSLQKSLEIFSGIEEGDWTLDNIKDKLMAVADPRPLRVAKRVGQAKNRGELLWPLRVALTGKEKSPSPWEVAWVIGTEESIKRINTAIDLSQS
jgi:glutamyl/glutaminyl-tRNA synthetase